MRITTELKRRDFLRNATGTAGLLALAAAGASGSSFAAEKSAKADPAALSKLMQEMEGQGRQMLSVPEKDGRFLSLMVRLARAKKVLEVGTSQGYSAIWMSLGLEETGGTLTTIDIAPEKVQLAKANVAKAGFASRVKLLEGDAHKIVPTLEGPFDLVFLDADKDGQMDYFSKLYPDKLTPGGILLVHNAISAAGAMKEYLDMISKHRDFDAVVLSLTMQDGFSVAYRHRT